MSFQDTPEHFDRALRAVLRVSDASPATEAPSEAQIHRLITALTPELRPRVFRASDLVAPPGDMVIQACRLFDRDDLASPSAPLGTATVRVLSAALHRPTALRADPRHLVVLHSMTNDDARLLLRLARCSPTPILARFDVRCEVLQHRSPSPRRIRLVDEDAVVVTPGDPPLTRALTGTLERLALVQWTEGVITPRENPGFTRARRRARLGTPTLREGLRRWLAGHHMAPVPDDEGGARATSSGVGGLELRYRILQLTTQGRGLAMALRPPAKSVDRRGQPFDERALKQMHAIRQALLAIRPHLDPATRSAT